MKNTFFGALVLALVFLSYGSSFSQERFYYSRGDTIWISPSPTKVILTKDPALSQAALNTWLSTSGLAQRFDLNVTPYGSKRTIITRKKEAMGELLRSLREYKDIYTATPVYATKDGTELMPTEEIVAKFKAGVSAVERSGILDTLNLETVKSRRGDPDYLILRIPRGADPIALANRLQESGLVEWSQPNFITRLVKPQALPNDAHFQRQFQMHNTGQQINNGRTGTADADVDGPEAWQVSHGAGVVVAVIDEGVDTGNPDFQAARLAAGYDFGDDDNNPSPGGNGAHGTACAGIIGATQNNNLGVTGIAPACTIMPIKIWRNDGTSATVADIADAIDFAWRNGADVLSNSWGFSSSSHNLFPAIDEAIDSAVVRGRNGRGCLVFFAAGNTADHGTGANGYVTYPGNYDSVVTVGASDRNDAQANYSPTDDEIDVVAPSHRAYRCQNASEDLEVWSTDITGNAGYNPWHETDACLPPNGTELPVGDRDFTGLMGGTSAACPLTAGIGALLLSVNPNLTRHEAESILKATADKIQSASGTYDATGFSRRFGFGRVNAHNAIVPSVSISIQPQRVGKGDPFHITVTSTAPFGLKSVWWFGDNTGIPDVDMAHVQNVSGGGKVYSYTWTTSINATGTYRLGANARDMLYPNPGDGFPHQASEGSGIAYATIKVPTMAEWAGIITAMLFVVTFAFRNSRNGELHS